MQEPMMPDDAERNPPIQEQMDGGELVRTRTVQDRQRGPAGRSGGILDAAQAPPQLDTDARRAGAGAQCPTTKRRTDHDRSERTSPVPSSTSVVDTRHPPPQPTIAISRAISCRFGSSWFRLSIDSVS